MLVSLCAETLKPVFEGDKIWQLWKEMHQFIECISCKSYITGEGRAELFRANRVMLVSLCAETIKPVFEGDKIWQLWKEMHQFIECSYPVSRT